MALCVPLVSLPIQKLPTEWHVPQTESGLLVLKRIQSRLSPNLNQRNANRGLKSSLNVSIARMHQQPCGEAPVRHDGKEISYVAVGAVPRADSIRSAVMVLAPLS